MAHFCELDENNIVKRTVVIDDNEVGENGSVAGEQYCQNLFGGGTWKQTSYGTEAGIHYTIAADGSKLNLLINQKLLEKIMLDQAQSMIQ